MKDTNPLDTIVGSMSSAQQLAHDRVAKSKPKFPAKEAYYVLAQQQPLDQEQSRAWLCIWKIPDPQRLNLIFLAGVSGEVPNELLFMRKSLETAICPCCEEAVEFRLHALCDSKCI